MLQHAVGQHATERGVVQEQRGMVGGQAELSAPNHVNEREDHG